MMTISYASLRCLSRKSLGGFGGEYIFLQSGHGVSRDRIVSEHELQCELDLTRRCRRTVLMVPPEGLYSVPMAQDGARSIRIQEPQFPVERRNSRHTFRCRAAPDNLRSSFAQTFFENLVVALGAYAAIGRNSTNKLMAVSFTTSRDTFVAGAVQPLFEWPAYPNNGFGVSNMGRRFLVMEPTGESSTSLTLLVNWQAGFK